MFTTMELPLPVWKVVEEAGDSPCQPTVAMGHNKPVHPAVSLSVREMARNCLLMGIAPAV